MLEKVLNSVSVSQKYFKYLYPIDFLIPKYIPLFLLNIENMGIHIMDNVVQEMPLSLLPQ